MGKVTVWESEADGKLFKDKEKYIKHLRKLAGSNIARRKIDHMEATRQIIMQKMGQVESTSDLVQFIKDNWQWFWANGANNEKWKWRDNKPSFHEFVDVKVENLKWEETCFNTHSCPQGGVTNFGRHYEDDRPSSYPGWRGTITIEVKPPSYKHRNKSYVEDGWGSSYFTDTIINTGSGSSVGSNKDTKKYSYGITLWAADFPVMYEKWRKWQWCEEENRKRRLVWKSLGGNQAVPEVYEVPDDWVLPSPWKQ